MLLNVTFPFQFCSGISTSTSDLLRFLSTMPPTLSLTSFPAFHFLCAYMGLQSLTFLRKLALPVDEENMIHHYKNRGVNNSIVFKNRCDVWVVVFQLDATWV